MHITFRLLGAVCLLLCLGSRSDGAGVKLRDTARSVLAKHQDVLVRVKLTIVLTGRMTFGKPHPQKMPGNDRVLLGEKIPDPKKKQTPPVKDTPLSEEATSSEEIKVDTHAEVTGTVLSADGLIAISSSSLISPTSGLDDLLGSSLDSIMGFGFPGLSKKGKQKNEKKDGKNDKGKSENESFDFMEDMQIKEVKIRLADGREVKGRIVGVDRKNDVTFLRPAKKLTKLPHLNLTDDAGRLDVLDDVIVLYPLSKTLKRRTAVTHQRIAAVADQKGNVPVLDLPATEPILGCPAFDADGRPIGIVTTAAPPKTSDAIMERGDLENIILGAEHIRAALKRLEKK